MPFSNSSVRGLSRDAQLDLRPNESCEQMMRRVDRRELDAIWRHLFGTARRLRPAMEPAR